MEAIPDLKLDVKLALECVFSIQKAKYIHFHVELGDSLGKNPPLKKDHFYTSDNLEIITKFRTLNFSNITARVGKTLTGIMSMIIETLLEKQVLWGIFSSTFRNILWVKKVTF